MPDSTNPSIAVVIAAKDVSQFIGATLDSLAEQTLPPTEIVVYDDGSSDNSADVVRAYAREIPSLRLIEGGESAGISKARNRANSTVSSEYIAVLDGDDLFAPDTVSQYARYLAEHPGTDLLYADTCVFEIDQKLGKRRHYPIFKSARSAIRRILGSPLVPFKHSSIVYRKEAFREVGGYDESLQIKVDIDLFLRFCAGGKSVAKLNEATSFHRKHGRQVSRDRLRGIKVYQHLIRTYEPDFLMRRLLMTTRLPSELLKLVLRG